MKMPPKPYRVRIPFAKGPKPKWIRAVDIVGAVLMILGFVCLLIKGMSTEYIDENGILHEYVFLLPMAFSLFFGGIVAFIAAGIGACIHKK